MASICSGKRVHSNRGEAANYCIGKIRQGRATNRQQIQRLTHYEQKHTLGSAKSGLGADQKAIAQDVAEAYPARL
jgi:hypothetical protein